MTSLSWQTSPAGQHQHSSDYDYMTACRISHPDLYFTYILTKKQAPNIWFY